MVTRMRPLPLFFLLLAACGGRGCQPFEEEEAPPLAMRQTALIRYTSTDLQTWTRDPTPVREGFVSLSMSVRPDGELWVTGIDQLGRASWWERNIRAPPVQGLKSRDGEHWTHAEWRVKDPETPSFVDSQWLGDELWYVAFKGRGDPVGAGNQTRIRSSPPPTTRAQGEGYSDPSPVRFQDKLYLFVTAWPQRVSQLAGEPLTEIQRWAGLSVPYATVINGELWLLAQKNLNGKRQPVVARSKDGRSFTQPRQMIPWRSVEHCTSPVMGPTPTGWVLLCVEEYYAGADRG